MNAARKLQMVEVLGEFSQAMISPKGMNALIGGRITGIGKSLLKMFPKFSWTGRKALQLALLVSRDGRASFNGKIAMIEIGKCMPHLRPDELLAVMTAMNHGFPGLLAVKKNVKMLKLR